MAARRRLRFPSFRRMPGRTRPGYAIDWRSDPETGWFRARSSGG